MSRFVTLVLLLCATLSFEIEAQSLCNSTNAIQNGFKLDANVGCSPFKVVPQDQSGLTDVQYIFDYRGQPATELGSLNPGLQDVLFNGANDQPRTYTILQYGKDANGVEKYSCQNLVVRVNLKPVASFNVCNNTTVEVSIPAEVRNNHDRYIINWGNSIETISNQDLPFNRIKTVAIDDELSIEGEFIGQNVSCDSKLIFKNTGNSSNQNAGKIDVKSIQLLDKVTAEITFEGSYSGNGYKLFMTKSGNTPNFTTPTLSNIKPGKIQVNLPDSIYSYCFTLTKEEVCGGTEVSPDFCTTPISDIKSTGDNNILTWAPHSKLFYNQFLALLFGNRNNTVTVRKKDLATNQITSVAIGPVSPYFDAVSCEKNYCYTITTLSEGVLFNRKFSYNSISNEVCIDKDKIKAPPLTNLLASFSESGEDKIVEFDDNSDWLVERNKYFLFTKNPNGEFITVDSIPSQLNKFNLGISEDSCFHVSFRDKCGFWSEKSPQVCTVSLSLNEMEELVWSQTNPFSIDAVGSFEVYAKNELSGNYELFGYRSNGFQDFNPDLTGFINEATFKIKIISETGKVSWSNSKSIPLEFKLFIPDAFSPNSDGDNDYLEFKGSLGRAEKLTFQIFDRWGKLVFVSESKDTKWDASINGKILPMGQYIYSFNAELKDGSFYKQTGVLELLK